MTGDHGRTSLVGGTRVSKCDPRIEAYGTVDELNSQIAMLAVGCKEPYPDIYDLLLMIQNKLFNIGAYLATENAKAALGIEDEEGGVGADVIFLGEGLAGIGVHHHAEADEAFTDPLGEVGVREDILVHGHAGACPCGVAVDEDRLLGALGLSQGLVEVGQFGQG